MKVTKSEYELIEMIMMLMYGGGIDTGFLFAKGKITDDIELTKHKENAREHAKDLMNIIGIEES